MIKQNIQSKYKYKENVMETKTNKLNARDFIFIGIFASSSFFYEDGIKKISLDKAFGVSQAAPRPAGRRD